MVTLFPQIHCGVFVDFIEGSNVDRCVNVQRNTMSEKRHHY